MYLSTNSYIAASTVLESLLSLTPCKDARRAVQIMQNRHWSFPTPDHDLLCLDLLIVRFRRNVGFPHSALTLN